MRRTWKLGIVLGVLAMILSSCFSAQQIKEWEAQQKQFYTITCSPGSTVVKTYSFRSGTLHQGEKVESRNAVIIDANLRGIDQLRLRDVDPADSEASFQISMRVEGDAPLGEQEIQLMVSFTIVDESGKFIRKDRTKKTLFIDIVQE